MSSSFQPIFPKPFSTDNTFEQFVHSSCEHLINGTSRAVHTVRGDKYVVKIALDENKVACNWIEITAFLEFQDDRHLLAKIFSWSKSGKFIVMEKLDTSAVPPCNFKAPSWVTDIGSKNGGVAADGNYKLCDYAFIKSPDEVYQSPYS